MPDKGAAVHGQRPQPRDQEDLEGHPFVGPPGRILDRARKRRGSIAVLSTSPML
jgi:uracil-DNA glycosylase